MTYIDEGKACAMKTWKYKAVDASGNLEILMEMKVYHLLLPLTSWMYTYI
jgi:hypothetical protein